MKADIIANGDSLTVKYSQDVTPYLENNLLKRNEITKTSRYEDETLNEVADIPNIVVQEWLHKGINIFKKEDMKKIRQLLNSPEYAYLKTRPGKI